MLNIDTRLLDEVKNGKLTPDEFFILLCISKRINRSNACFPSMKLLQEETTFGYNKVFDCLKSLNEKGYITKERRRLNGKLTSNLYILHTKYIGVYISVDNQEFLPPENQAVEIQSVENQTVSIKQSSVSIKQSSLSKKSSKEKIEEFFDNENLPEIVKSKLIPYENQIWWDQQAQITLETVKEGMIKHFEKKEIKDMKSTFVNWILKLNRNQFYRYPEKQFTHGVSKKSEEDINYISTFATQADLLK